MRPAHALLATLGSAALYGLCFSPPRLTFLAWFALVPFFTALRSAGTGRALLLAWVWTTATSYGVADWLPRAIAGYYEQGLLVGFAFLFGVSWLMLAPSYLVFAACYRVLARRPGPALPLLAGAAWVAAELARAKLLTGNPWALLGYSQVDAVPLIQIADVTGVYGLSFLLAATNAALTEVCLAATAAERRLRGALAGLALTAVALTVALAYGVLRLDSPSLAPDGPPVKVALVQGNLDLGSQWREEFYGRNLDVYLRLTRHVIAKERPRLVFWPENAMTFFLQYEPRFRGTIAGLLGRRGVQLVAGGPHVVAASAPRYFNSIFLISPHGGIMARYDKQLLVPFTEYFPFARLDLLRRRFARVREFTAGAPAPLLPTVAGPAGVTICNEAMFPEVAAARVRAGAGYLVDPANDSWFSARFSAEQFDIVRLRAVEQRRYLVRASTSGPSAIVDPFGRVVVRTAPATQAVVAGEIRTSTVVTPYCRIGDLFAYLCGAAALAAWAAAPRNGTSAT